MAHILVTGANGFIGSHLVRKLLELKKKENWEEDIVCLVRSTSDLSWLKGLDVKLVIGDLRDEETLVKAVQGATYIYHLGAELYTISRKRFLETNTEGTRNLLKVAAKYAKNSLKRFLFTSSQAAAGPAPDKVPINEESPPPPPISWYAEAKLEAEKIAKKFMSELPITIVRPCTVYGERDLALIQVYKAVKMRIRPLTGFKKRYTCMVYSPDLVEGIIAAARHPQTIGETYFLSDSENYSVGQMVKTMAKAVNKPWGVPFPIPIFVFRIVAIFSELLYLFFRGKPIPSRDKVRDISQVFWLCTPAKAKKDFGWEAKHSLLEGMKTTCKYYKEEERTRKKMPLEPAGLLWMKYCLVSMIIGLIIESLAIYGKMVYTPWWQVLIIVPGMWGLIFGSLAKVTRVCNFVVQFLPGFFIITAAELLNHFQFHKWYFTNDYVFGVTIRNPVMRAVALGIATGFIIPLVNALMRKFYKRKLRLG